MADITVIGGINIDIEGAPFAPLKYQDSNPGHVSVAFGGVGRNIKENGARMGGDMAMVSVIGDDQMGRGAKAELETLGVDTSRIVTVPGRNSAMYLSILDEKRDMEIALCDMDIIEHITPALLQEHEAFLRQSKMIALDGNLEQDLLEYATEQLGDMPLFFDPVSAAKAVKAKDIIGRFHSVKPNVMEAEILSGIEIKNEDDLKRAAQWLLDQGVKRVFVTLNKDGVYYKERGKEGFIRPRPDLKLVSATGAGDSFSASILLGFVKNMDIEEIARMGMAAASIAMESSQAVNKEMNLEELQRRMETCLNNF